MKKLRVLFAAAEMTPLAKTGGLGDVIGALPKELHGKKQQVSIALPLYTIIPRDQLRDLTRIATVTIHIKQKPITVVIWRAHYPGVKAQLLLFQQSGYLSTGDVYDGLSVTDPEYNRPFAKEGIGICVRFMVFSYALHEFLKKYPKKFDIVHAHDFHLAPLLALIRQSSILHHIKTVLTIHNLFYNGPLPKPYWNFFQPNLLSLFNTTEAARPKGPRMLWLGIEQADAITTVSQQYGKDILTPEYGCELELALQKNKRKLTAVLNGIDTAIFNPQTDPALHVRFGVNSRAKRLANKLWLQQRCHLPVNPHTPVIGLVTRLAAHKGIELVINSIHELSDMHAQFVICGMGPKRYVAAFQTAEEHHPHIWHIHKSFDPIFSQYVYGGADIFLMPSRHEPCGLAQLIAMRYGAVPVVRATGGLKDTVTDGYNGFVFTKYSSQTMLQTVKRAVKMYHTEKKKWDKLVEHGMTDDYGWKKSAQAYAKLYRSLL